jgi:hypothetical protein
VWSRAHRTTADRPSHLEDCKYNRVHGTRVERPVHQLDRIVFRGHGTTADRRVDDQFEVVNITGLTGYRGGNFKLAVWVQLLISVNYSRPVRH